jgi:hypothetical protein
MESQRLAAEIALSRLEKVSPPEDEVGAEPPAADEHELDAADEVDVKREREVARDGRG